MKKYLFIALAIASTALGSCKKETEEETPFEGGITIIAPITDDTMTGPKFILVGNINGNMAMHGYHVVLYKQSDNSVIAEYDKDEHATSITIHDTITHGLATPTAVRLYIESAYNHEGDVTSKEVNFVIEP